MEPNTIKLIDKDDYYKDFAYISFSGLKVYSKCETLYRDLFVSKVYEEPERDYFVYGKLVDALVTEKPEFINENFIKVERKINPEDALKFENQIKALNEEVAKKEIELEEKFKAKEEAFILKIKAIEEKDTPTPAQLKKLAELRANLNDLTMNREENLDKTLVKGIASRKAEASEIQLSLDAIKDLADKQQVTPAVWQNAESTALALKTHPYFSQMEFNSVTSQQIFTSVIDGIPRKGKLDHLKLSPALTKFYAIYLAKQLTLEDLQARIREMNPQDLWAIITDVKTCYSVEKLEPFNKHYRGQLRFYQDLVMHTLLIPKEKIKCQIFVSDKVTNEFKMAELLVYSQEALDELWPDILEWMKFWQKSMQMNKFVSSKEKLGMEQKCFTCSECRFCPFSRKPGEAVLIIGPRFKSSEEAVQMDISTADAVLDY